jgi:hypothetical protein
MDVKNFQPTHNYDTPEKKKRGRISAWISRLVFLGLIAAVIIVLFGFVLPSVEVTVYYTSEDFVQSYEIFLDSNLKEPNIERQAFPASTKEAVGEEQQKFTTTGKKNSGDKASGQVTFYNYTGRSQPLTASVELNHASGKIYFLKNELTVPAATVSDNGDIVPGQVKGDLEAKDAGTEYNQKSGRLNISVVSPDLQAKIYGDTGDLNGGTDKVVAVMSAEDLQNAENDLVGLLTPKLKDKIKSQLQKGVETLRDELTSFELLSSEKSVELDTEAKEFDLKISGKLKAVIINENDLKKNLRALSLLKLPAGRLIADDDFGELTFEILEANFSTGIARLKVTVKYKSLPQTDLSHLKDQIQGLSEIEARRLILGLPLVRDVHFDFSMNLWNKIPKNINKIKIKLGNR